MTTATLTERDIRIRDAVRSQLDWDPEVDASAVGVTARQGAVTLTGFIDTYAGKLAAERAAKRVYGVRAVANDVDVRLRLERTDADIAQDVVRALQLRSSVPEGVQAAVHNGHVTLTGETTWLYQKAGAAAAIKHIRGVRGVKNYIAIEPDSEVPDVGHRITTALHQTADVDARHITVAVAGNTATLSGTVDTWLQRECAEGVATAAPGIAHVDNQILVQSFYDAKVTVVDQEC